MIKFSLLILLYIPVLVLGILYLFKDRYKFEIKENVHRYSLLIAIVAIGIQLSHYLFYSYWFECKIFGIAYNPTSWELIVLIWNLVIFSLILFSFKFLRISILGLIYFKKDYIFKMFKVGFILTTAIVLLTQLFGVDITDKTLRDSLVVIRSMSQKQLVLFSINTLIIIPIVEEVVFRGLLYGSICQKVGRSAALFIASYIFLHSHFGVLLQNIFGSIVIFLKGYFLTWLYDRKRTLVYPIGCHIMLNAWFLYFQFFD